MKSEKWKNKSKIKMKVKSYFGNKSEEKENTNKKYYKKKELKYQCKFIDRHE